MLFIKLSREVAQPHPLPKFWGYVLFKNALHSVSCYVTFSYTTNIAFVALSFITLYNLSHNSNACNA